MSKLMLASLTLAMLIFSGCSQKNPEVDSTMGNNSQSQMSNADKKADDLSGMDSNGINSNSMDSNGMDKNTADAIANAIATLEGDINKIYFDFDKYNVRADMQSKVEANANLLNAMDAKNFSIKVEGNCDEWGTDEYNYALGLKRAKSVKEDLINDGVSSDRIMIVSYGESNPACREKNRACWDKNRRAEFKILP